MERLKGGLRSHGQVKDMVQLPIELIAGRGVAPWWLKLERPETNDGAKHCHVNTWLFQVEEHMWLTRIPADSQGVYTISLLKRTCYNVVA